MEVKSGEVPAYPLRRRNVARMTFLTKAWSKQWNMKDSKMSLNFSRDHELPPCPYMNILLKIGKANSSFDIGNSFKHAIYYQKFMKELSWYSNYEKGFFVVLSTLI